MHIVVTRPEPDGERTAAELRARGHEVTLAPLLRIEAVADVELGAGPWTAVLLTSANGARAIGRHPRRGELTRLPVLTVGRRSADAARAVGFADVTSADGDGSDLARLAAARFAGAKAPLLHLTGEDRARDLKAELQPHGLSLQTITVYRAAKIAKLPPAVSAALQAGQIDAVLHFSARSAENYVDCAREVLDRALAPVHYCLSQRSAEPLRVAGAADVRVAARPDEAALLALVTARPQ